MDYRKAASDAPRAAFRHGPRPAGASDSASRGEGEAPANPRDQTEIARTPTRGIGRACAVHPGFHIAWIKVGIFAGRASFDQPSLDSQRSGDRLSRQPRSTTSPTATPRAARTRRANANRGARAARTAPSVYGSLGRDAAFCERVRMTGLVVAEISSRPRRLDLRRARILGVS